MKIDAIQTASAPTLSVGRRSHSLFAVPAVAAVGLTTVWASGLAAWPTNLDLAASSAKALATYRVHQDAGMTQYLLVEGLAAIALTVVVAALAVAGVALARTSWSLKAAT